MSIKSLQNLGDPIHDHRWKLEITAGPTVPGVSIPNQFPIQIRTGVIPGAEVETEVLKYMGAEIVKTNAVKFNHIIPSTVIDTQTLGLFNTIDTWWRAIYDPETGLMTVSIELAKATARAMLYSDDGETVVKNCRIVGLFPRKRPDHPVSHDEDAKRMKFSVEWSYDLWTNE